MTHLCAKYCEDPKKNEEKLMFPTGEFYNKDRVYDAFKKRLWEQGVQGPDGKRSIRVKILICTEKYLILN